MNNRKLKVEFGIIGIGGFIITKPSEDGNSSEATLPLFVSESSRIKTTFNRNIKYVLDGEEKLTSDFGNVYYEDQHLGENGVYYQKKYLRNVLWNFGDGTLKEGYNVEHHYSKPGKYKITCVLFDINRRGWTNTYSISVQVKEIIPTTLKFSENVDDHKKSIRCSKIEKITKIESLIGKDVDELKIVAKRIFSETEHRSGLPKSYWDVNNQEYYYMYPYYCFLKDEKIFLNNSSDVISSYMIPVKKYEGNYYEIYGKLRYNEATKNIIYDLAIFSPFKIKEDSHFKMKCVDPNSNIIEEEKYIDVDVRHISSEKEKGDLEYLGKRAFVDVYYKNDIISKADYDNNISFFYDIEETKMNNEMKSGSNYLNLIPLGMSLTVEPNDIDDAKMAISLNGFLRNVDNNKEYHVDEYFYNSMVKNYKLNAFFTPYIPYTSENETSILEGLDIEISSIEKSDFLPVETTYYIPKDISIVGLNYNSTGKYIGHDTSLSRVMDVGNDTFCCYNFVFGDYINHDYTFSLKSKTGTSKITMSLLRTDIPDIYSLIVPTEKRMDVDVKRLVNLYLGHPMFDEAHKLKDGLISLLKNEDFLSYVMTKGENFLDDRSNIKTCYLSNLLSTLKMMGEEVTDYETSEFEGVNAMRDFIRILSMNHSDLVGHVVNKSADIRVLNGTKGNNVGRKMDINDKLFISTHITDSGKSLSGLIMGFEPYFDGKYGSYRNCYSNVFGTHLIVQDKFTKETKIISFTTISNLNDILITDETTNRKYISIKYYDESWGWNLLLGERFKSIKKDLKTIPNMTSSRRKKMEDACADIIEGYYDFYLYNPVMETERVGNFLDERTITEDVENTSSWEAKWGFVNDILMKIIIENSNLKNDITAVEEDDYNEPIKPLTVISEEKIFGVDDGAEIDITFRGTNDHPYYIDRDASISINSHINNNDENKKYTIFVSIKNFNILNNREPEFFESVNFLRGQRVELEYNIDIDEETFENSDIELEETTIPLYVDEKEKYDARLKLSMNGTISNPIINAVMILEFV